MGKRQVWKFILRFISRDTEKDKAFGKKNDTEILQVYPNLYHTFIKCTAEHDALFNIYGNFFFCHILGDLHNKGQCWTESKTQV